jgi:hypothetical protein
MPLHFREVCHLEEKILKQMSVWSFSLSQIATLKMCDITELSLICVAVPLNSSKIN